MKTLVLAEKPSVAHDYAQILKCTEKHQGYYEGKSYVVTYAVGHLFTLKEPEDYDPNLKSWNLTTLPIIPQSFQIKSLSSTFAQFKVIKELINRPDICDIINGGDSGREGELIQRYILAAAANKKPVKRLWLSSLTKPEIEKGFNNLKPSEEYDNLYYAAKTRNEMDWLIGINYTRAYTKKKAKDVVLSVGRCQTPILHEIVKRDIEIKNFKSTDYYEIEVEFEDYRGKYFNENTTKIMEKSLADEIINSIKDKTGTIIELKEENKKVLHPLLFNLTDLQKVMANKYGFSESDTLKIAQKLYETEKILSYPRTASNHLSEGMAIEFPERLNVLKQIFASQIENLDMNNLKITNRFVDDTKLSDHHALVPTLNADLFSIYPKLSKDEKLLFDEVALRFIACFYPENKYLSVNVITQVNEYHFKTTGKKEISKGWKTIYVDDTEEKEESLLQSLKEGDIKKITETEIKKEKTKPQPHYTVSSILTLMQKYSIGTEATRAAILGTLEKRNYIQRQKIKLISTELGQNLINAIGIDELKDLESTSIMEKQLESIVKGEVKREDILNKSIEDIKRNIEIIKNETDDTTIGKTSICVCPQCKQGNIIKKKNAYGCTNYKDTGCDFIISSTVAGKELNETQIKKLIEKSSTDLLKFKGGKGDFEAFLILIEKEGKLTTEFKFPEKLKCPVCEIGYIQTTKFGYGCSNWKNGCKFSISAEIMGVKITEKQVQKLCIKGKTDTLSFDGKFGKFKGNLTLENGKTTIKKV